MKGLNVFALFITGAMLISACGNKPKVDAYGESNAARISEASVVVEMKGLQFGPQGIRVKPGTTVTWVNNDPVVHNVRQVRSVFLSPEEMPEGASFSFRFDEPGTYRYQCTYHHPNMNGVVIVEAE